MELRRRLGRVITVRKDRQKIVNANRFSRSVRVYARLDATFDVGEVEPDFYAAEVRAFGANRSGDSRAQITGRADVFRELWMNLAQLIEFVHRRAINFFLRVETG